MYKGRVDSDTEALNKRIDFNKNSKYDLELFIFEKLKLKGNESILEIGCGTGKQTIKIKQKYPNVKLTATDISQKMLDNIQEKNIKKICIDMDKLFFKDIKFDLILSVYSFYYSKDMVALCKKIRNWVNPGGRVCLFGPSEGTNKEIINLANEVKPNSMYHTENFINETQLKEIGIKYEKVYLENKINFKNKDEILTWWKNHNSYQPDLEFLIKNKIEDSSFSLTKNVLGVILHV